MVLNTNLKCGKLIETKNNVLIGEVVIIVQYWLLVNSYYLFIINKYMGSSYHITATPTLRKRRHYNLS